MKVSVKRLVGKPGGSHLPAFFFACLRDAVPSPDPITRGDLPIASSILMDSLRPQIDEVSYAIWSLIGQKLFLSPSEHAGTDGLNNAIGSQMTIRIY